MKATFEDKQEEIRQEKILVKEDGGNVVFLGDTFSLSINKHQLLNAMGYHVCERCGTPFDPLESGDPVFCKKCKAT
jgi:hypothetical protein